MMFYTRLEMLFMGDTAIFDFLITLKELNIIQGIEDLQECDIVIDAKERIQTANGEYYFDFVFNNKVYSFKSSHYYTGKQINDRAPFRWKFKLINT